MRERSTPSSSYRANPCCRARNPSPNGSSLIAALPPCGFTLIEAIMVIAILAAVAVGTSFRASSGWQDQAKVRDVASLISKTLTAARNTAMLNRADVVVQLDQNAVPACLRIFEKSGPLHDGKESKIELLNDVRVNAAVGDVTFSPMATADRAASWTVTSGKSQRRVTLNPLTGVITTAAI